LQPSQTGLANRIIGGNVWFKDHCMELASSRDNHDLPKILALGAALVEKKALTLVKG